MSDRRLPAGGYYGGHTTALQGPLDACTRDGALVRLGTWSICLGEYLRSFFRIADALEPVRERSGAGGFRRQDSAPGAGAGLADRGMELRGNWTAGATQGNFGEAPAEVAWRRVWERAR